MRRLLVALIAIGTGLAASAEAGPRDRDGRSRGDARWLERPCCGDGVRRLPRARPSDEPNGPIYQTQEQVQQSVYDFAAGRRGNIREYWRE